MNPSNNKVPKHIGFIMDGNRRFAKRLMAKPWKGHEWGRDKLRKVLEWCREMDINEATFYAFSIQNFNRPKDEFNFLMNIFKKGAEDLLNHPDFKNNKYDARINFIGRIDMFPKEVSDRMKKIMELTKNNKKYVVNFAVAYGGREEVIDAIKKIGNKIKSGKLDVDKINQEVFAKELYVESEPDMIIRTGGEFRTSNFLPWQSVYSEWFFVEKMWPEIEKEDVVNCIKEYSERERRFGK